MGKNESILPTTGNKVIEGEPIARALKYHHLGLAVSDLAASRAFYEKLGFVTVSDTIMRNNIGMEIHLLQSGGPAKDDKNILQDMGDEKYCGHTHACFAVPSVKACKAYLEGQGIAITGDRVMGGEVRSVFVRDPDRNTLEFERNIGDEVVENFVGSMIGDARPIDHVGTRVTNPPRAWKWYGEMLGFTEEVMFYEHNPDDPLKNFAPWIARTRCGMDINLLLNGNQPSSVNAMLTDGSLKPGFLYAGLEVKDVEASKEALKKAGAAVFTDDEVSSLGLKKEEIPSCDGPAFFIADPDMNLYRFVQAK